MPVAATDIKIKLSGGAANALPGASLGGARSATDIAAPALNNLFDNVLAGEAAAGSIEHRCVYVTNTHATDTVNTVTMWMNAATPAPGSILELGLDPAGNGDGSVTGVAPAVADELTAPAGVTFTEPDSSAEALAIGTLGPGESRAVWVRRSIVAGAASYNNDGATLIVRGVPAI